MSVVCSNKQSHARYEEQLFFVGVHEAFSQLRQNPNAWASYESEVSVWNATLNDGAQFAGKRGEISKSASC